MPKPYFGKQPVPEYKPSDETRAAIKAWQEAVDLEERTRHAARAALAADLKADKDLPFRAVADHPLVPWTEATLRLLKDEYDIPPRQPNKAAWRQELRAARSEDQQQAEG
ncbi:hypothetical protein [Streptomyces sp. NPDC006334]|uniref:hypothetical protein n=1 Tax=Streptomyces sp. NPDC006334 TaxID=3156754 RepID=UPI0033B55501